MNPWTERILERATKTLQKQGKTVDEAVDMLIGNSKETINKTDLKKKLKEKSTAQ